jgi:diacylglycerol kinase family enzyme
MNASTVGFGAGLRYGFLVNPVSGSGRGRLIHDQLPSILDGLGLPRSAWIRELTVPKAVPEQARRILSECDRLVVAGGDGTIGQALEGMRLSNRADAALGVIPLGTGNDLARELRLLEVFQDKGLGELVRTLLEDRISPLDLWDVGGRAVLANYLSFGSDGWVTEVFGRSRDLSGSRHSTLGIKLGYARAGIGSLARHLPQSFHIRARLADGSILDRGLGGHRSLLALNVGSYASGLLRPMRTRADDGLLTLMSIPHLWNYPVLVATSAFPRLQGFFQRRMLLSWQATSFEASWTGPNAVQVDGEGRRDLLSSGRLEVSHAGRARLLSGSGRP